MILDYRPESPLPVLESYEEIKNSIFFEGLKEEKKDGETK